MNFSWMRTMQATTWPRCASTRSTRWSTTMPSSRAISARQRARSMAIIMASSWSSRTLSFSCHSCRTNWSSPKRSKRRQQKCQLTIVSMLVGSHGLSTTALSNWAGTRLTRNVHDAYSKTFRVSWRSKERRVNACRIVMRRMHIRIWLQGQAPMSMARRQAVMRTSIAPSV